MDGCFTFKSAPANISKRRHGFGIRMLFPIAALTAFALSSTVFAASQPSSKKALPSKAACDAEMLAQLLIQANGPFNQRLIAQTVETQDGTSWIIGTETAMKQLDPKAVEVHKVLNTLTGEGSDSVIVARAITGSLARMKLTRIANDLDFEGMLVAHVKEGAIENLHDPNSAEVKQLVGYFRSHVEEVLAENPHYRFIELKAGEYTDPETSEVKGIKWWLEDVRRGYKEVVEPSGRRIVTLEQVFAEDARIKADWAVPALPDSPVKGAYTEASVLYRLGYKVGNNQIRLRVSKNGHDESLPVRATTVALAPEDMSLLLEASQATSSTALEYVHQLILHGMTKYQKVDHLKVLKRVFSLLQFWDEVDDYNVLHGTQFTHDSLTEDFLTVLRDQQITELGQLKAQAELLKVLEEHGLELPSQGAQKWIATVRDRYDIRYKKLDLIIETLAKRIDKRLAAKLEGKPHLKEYVDFVVAQIPYTEGSLTKSSVFLTLQPDAEFREKLTQSVEKWKQKYPNLHFNNPEDAHMTVQFLGRMTDKGIEALLSNTAGLGEGHVFSGGGAHLMGRNMNLIALAYEPDPTFAQVVGLARAKASSFGARPEKRFRAYRPHITIASFDNSSPASRAEAQRFMQEVTSMLETVKMHGMDVWTRGEADPAAADPAAPAYAPYKPKKD